GRWPERPPCRSSDASLRLRQPLKDARDRRAVDDPLQRRHALAQGFEAFGLQREVVRDDDRDSGLEQRRERARDPKSLIARAARSGARGRRPPKTAAEEPPPPPPLRQEMPRGGGVRRRQQLHVPRRRGQAREGVDVLRAVLDDEEDLAPRGVHAGSSSAGRSSTIAFVKPPLGEAAISNAPSFLRRSSSMMPQPRSDGRPRSSSADNAPGRSSASAIRSLGSPVIG